MRLFNMNDTWACNLLLMVVLSVLTVLNDAAIIKEPVIDRPTQGRQKRNPQPGGFMNFQDFISTADGINLDDVHTPSPIRPEDAECFIEVQRVEAKPGKCKTIGRAGIKVCSAGEYLSINDRQCGGGP